jgi:hypothetical protein
MLSRMLSHREPFTRLDRDALETLARQARVVRLAAARRVATAYNLCYLVKGSLNLRSALNAWRLRATDAAAAGPLPDSRTGVVTETLEPSEILFVDVTPVAFLLERPPLSGFDARWLDDGGPDGDWSVRFLRRGFGRAPPRLLQRAFAALEPRAVAANERLFEEGARGDSYFIVRSGGVEIRRSNGEFARLGAGDAFGEEALLGDGRRRASATALAESRLMRLSSPAFFDWLLPAAVPTVSIPAGFAANALIVDLDRSTWRDIDARTWIAKRVVEPGQISAMVVVGGGPRARLRWAFLAARAGFEVVAGDG